MAAVRVGCVQIANVDATTAEMRDGNVRHAVELIRQVHADRPHDVYILPELSTVGYADPVFPVLEQTCERIDGPSVRVFGALAQELGCFVSFGFPRTVSEGVRNITHVVVDPSGAVIVTYNKEHLCQFGECAENNWFTAGVNDRAPVFEVKGIRFGLRICYDFRFPESFRTLALRDRVDAILHPCVFPMDVASPSWHPFVMTRALENQVYVLSVSKAGAHYGKSFLCPPWVEADGPLKPVTLGDDEQIYTQEIDPQVIARVRTTYALRNDMLSKERELYSS